MKRQHIITLAILIFTLAQPALAARDTEHIHGQAVLSIMLDRADIYVDIVIPAQSVVGFEHIPVYESEKIAVNRAKERLKTGDLLLFEDNIEALLKETDIVYTWDDYLRLAPLPERSTLWPDLPVSPAQPATQNHTIHQPDDPHAQFQIRYHYVVNAPEKLTKVSWKFSDHFVTLDTIQVQLIHNLEGYHQMLTSGDSSVVLK